MDSDVSILQNNFFYLYISIINYNINSFLYLEKSIKSKISNMRNRYHGDKIMKYIVFILVLFLSLTSCESPEDAIRKEQINLFNNKLDSYHQKDSFNGAILISQNEEVFFMNSYGYTDVTRTEELTTQSSFRLASVSKQFTAAAIMILKEKNKLDFEDNIIQYLPELEYEDITIRHLLNHTSGLPDYMNLAERYRDNLKILTVPDVLSMFKKHPQKLNFNPGDQFEYSNTGYIFLSEIISRVSGISFEEFLRREIFQPLKMKNSSVVNLLSDKNVLQNRTRGFNGKLDISNHWFDGVSGDGGVFVSIEDFLIWGKSLRENEIISKSTWIEAISPAILNSGEKSFYGFGWFLSEDNSFISHGGGWLGARTYIFMDIKNNGLIVVLASTSNSAVSYISNQAMELYNSSLIRKEL